MRPIQLDPYLIDTLLPDLVGHDRHPSAFLVYLYLWRHTIATGEKSIIVSLSMISDETGVSKSAVQEAVRRLHRRQLLRIRRDSVTATPEYEILQPWLRLRR